MTKRILSMVCCLTLLLGCLAGLGLTAAAEEAATWSCKSISATPEGSTNLVEGLIPTRGVTSSRWAPRNAAGCGTIDLLTDNTLCTDNETQRVNFSYGAAGFYAFTFDMGDLYNVTDFVVGSEAGADQRQVWTQIYVSDRLDTLYDTANMVIEKKGTTKDEKHLQYTLAQAAEKVRYVGFNLYAIDDNNRSEFSCGQWYAMIRLGELAVYGTAAGGYTVTEMKNDADGQALLAELGAKTNLVKGINAKSIKADGTLGGGVANNYGKDTDGVIPGMNYTEDDNFALWNHPDCLSVSSLDQHYQLAKQSAFCVALSDTWRVKQLMIALQINQNYFARTLWIGSVYLGNDPATILSKENLVYSWNMRPSAIGTTQPGNQTTFSTVTDTQALVIDLDEAVEASYVAYVLPEQDWGSTRVPEIAVYGDMGEDVTSAYGNITFLNGTEDAALIPPTEMNLLKDRIVGTSGTVNQTALFYDTNVDGTLTAASLQAPLSLVDGEIKGVTATTQDNTNSMLSVGNKYVNFTNPAYATTAVVVADLGKAQMLEKVLVGYAHDSNVRMRQWFGKVYVGNDPKTLVADENLVGSWSYVINGEISTAVRNDQGALVSFEPREARYVAIKLPVNATGYSGDPGKSVRFQELGVYAAQSDIFSVDGGQIRTENNFLPAGGGGTALRLINTVAIDGVTVGDNYVGDYTNATITIGGAAYPVVEVGTLVATEASITKMNLVPEEALVYGLDATIGKAVPAKKIYDVSDDGKSITYTAVITNIPYYLYGEDICARGYVCYRVDENTVKTVYGDVMTRNVYDVWADTDDANRQVLDRADYLQDGQGYFEKNARVVFLGDSITNNAAFIGEILQYYAAKYPQDKVEMYMAGVKGGTATGGLTYLNEQVLALNPDYVSIMFGMNDIGREGYSTGYDNASDATKANIETYAADMEAIVKTLRAKGVKVILCTPSPYDETTTGTTTKAYVGCAEALRLCGEKAKALAAKYGCDVVDFNSVMNAAVAYVQDAANGGSTDYTIIGKDRVHPGTLGHDLMARIFLKTIGEDVTVPSNEYLLSCLKGESSVNHLFQDISAEFSAKVKAVSTNCVAGGTNRRLCSYFEGEFFFIGTENYHTMPLEQKIAVVSALNGKYSGDWRGTECIPNFETNAKNVGSNRAAVIEAAKAVYAN